MGDSAAVNIALEFVERINAHDLDGICALMTDDFVFTDYEGKIERGKELMRKGWEGYLSSFPKYKIIAQHVLIGAGGVAIIGKTTGSHLPPELEEKETVLWTAEIRDGLVAEWRIYSDSETIQKS